MTDKINNLDSNKTRSPNQIVLSYNFKSKGIFQIILISSILFLCALTFILIFQNFLSIIVFLLPLMISIYAIKSDFKTHTFIISKSEIRYEISGGSYHFNIKWSDFETIQIKKLRAQYFGMMFEFDFSKQNNIKKLTTRIRKKIQVKVFTLLQEFAKVFRIRFILDDNIEKRDFATVLQELFEETLTSDQDKKMNEA